MTTRALHPSLKDKSVLFVFDSFSIQYPMSQLVFGYLMNTQCVKEIK